MNTPVLDQRVARYLERLSASLRGVPDGVREDVVDDIRAHILEALESNSDPQALPRVFNALGEPEDLAERYRTEFLFARAAHSFSPWVLLRSAWRWALMGVRGFVVFMIALTGYSMALAFYITAILKPIIPNEIGLWVGPGVFNFGAGHPGGPTHEILGPYYIFVAMMLGFVCALVTTQLLRFVMRGHARGATQTLRRFVSEIAEIQ